MEPGSTRLPFTNEFNISCYKKISILFVVAAFLFIIHRVHSNGKYFAKPELPPYTVVLDCGSTGTRINIYEWSRNKIGELVLLRSFPDFSSGKHVLRHSCQYHCMQSEPGLDKFAYNFSSLSSALEPLLIWAEKNIPSNRQRYTPIFILGTAGLRKLPVEESDWIMMNAEAVVKKHHFIYKQSWIRVLTGEEEAYYAWVALNYKLGRLHKLSKSTTLGIVDLGGSSMQVAMETKKPIEDQHYFKPKIGPVDLGLLTYSLSGFGLNDAFDRSIILANKDLLAKKWINGRFELKHPCLNKGFARNYTCLTCSRQLRSIDPQNTDNVMLIGQRSLIHLVGYPNWIKCKALARSTAMLANISDFIQLSRNMDCNHYNSIYGGMEAGTIEGSKITSNRSHPVFHFHALSGFSIVYSSLIKHLKTNLTEFLGVGEQLCSRSWADINEEHGKQKYAEQSCFRIPYIVSLMKDAMCLTDAEITFGPADISWTLGAALIEGGLLQLTKSESSVDRFISNNLKATSFILFLLAVAFCIYSVVFCRKFKRVILHLLSARKGGLSELPLASYLSSKRQVH